MSVQNCVTISNRYDFQAHQHAFPKNMFFPDYCTVSEGSPRHFASSSSLSVSAPRLVAATSGCFQVPPQFSPALLGVPKLVTMTPIAHLHWLSGIAVTLNAGRNALPGYNSLLKLTHLDLHSIFSQTLQKTRSE
jgi:hypothetical protein